MADSPRLLEGIVDDDDANVSVNVRVVHMSDNAKEASIAASKSRSDVAKAKADEENYRCAIPAQEERKRDTRKTYATVLAIVGMVIVAAWKVPASDLGHTIEVIAGILIAAWKGPDIVRALKSGPATPQVGPQSPESPTRDRSLPPPSPG